MSNSLQAKAILFFGAGLVLIVFVIAVVLLRRGGPGVPPALYSADVAKQALDFAGYVTKKCPQSGVHLCSSKSNCTCDRPDAQEDIPLVAWKLLAHTAKYRMSPSEAVRGEAFALLRRTQKLMFASPGANFLSMHQFVKAAAVFGEPSFLDYFVDQSGYIRQMGVSGGVMGPDYVTNVMSKATLVQQLYSAVRIAIDDALWSNVTVQVAREPSFREHFKTQSLQGAADMFGRLMDASMDPLSSKNPTSCWTIWALYSRYRALGAKGDLDTITQYFDQFAEYAKTGTIPQFATTQTLITCVEVLTDLVQDPATAGGDTLLRARKQFVQWLVDQSWDGPETQKCYGDKGFMAIPPTSPNDPYHCANVQKYLADAAWAAYVLGEPNIAIGSEVR